MFRKLILTFAGLALVAVVFALSYFITDRSVARRDYRKAEHPGELLRSR